MSESTPAVPPVPGPTSSFFLDALIQSSPVGLAVMDRDYRFVMVNEVLAAINGASVAAHLGRTPAELIPDIWPHIEPLYAAVLRGEVVRDQEVVGRTTPDRPEPRHWRVHFAPLRCDGAIVGLGITVQEVSEQQRLEVALRKRTDLYAMMAQANRVVSERRPAPELFDALCRIAVEVGRFRFAWVGVPRDGFLQCIACAGEDHGYMEEVLIALDPADPRSHGPSGRAARTGLVGVVNDFQQEPMTALWHERARRADFAASAAFPIFERGQVAAVLSLYAGERGYFTPEMVETLGEITPSVSFALDALAQERERQRDEAELRLLNGAVRAARQGIVISDVRTPDEPIVFASAGFERVTGYPVAEAIGRNCRFLQGPGTDAGAVSRVREAIREGRPCMVEFLNYRKDGTPFWNELVLSPVEDATGRVSHYVGVQSDVTQRRHLQEQLVQSQKMEALGRLAGGVAHDFNNLLSAVMASLELAIEELPAGHSALRDLHVALDATRRGGRLTRQLLAFSRKQVLQLLPHDLNGVVRDAERLLQRVVGEAVTLDVRLAPAPAMVHADASQLEQVLMNLAVNARDAMPEGGRLTIAVAAPDAGAEMPGQGRFVSLEVTDTGTGIAASHLDRLFEPFFTTKEEGKGTGLGLATVDVIVRQLGGHVRVRSEEGHGTTFTVLLPRHEGSMPQGAGAVAAADRTRGATLLVVEDDLPVRTALVRGLERHGFTVVAAEHGADALAQWQARGPAAFDALLTDARMPGIGGVQLASMLRHERPDLPVVVMSGYVEAEASGLEVGRFLQKPFSTETLLRTLQQVLQASS